MPSDTVFKALNAVHKLVLKTSWNRLGWHLGNMPVLRLTTIGRVSGRPRSVMLTVPYQDAGRIVVVASKGGEPRHPAWLLNLRENPSVAVRMKGQVTSQMRARVAFGNERARLWNIVTTAHPRYARYQSITQREIPLVLLEKE